MRRCNDGIARRSDLSFSFCARSKTHFARTFPTQQAHGISSSQSSDRARKFLQGAKKSDRRIGSSKHGGRGEGIEQEVSDALISPEYFHHCSEQKRREKAQRKEQEKAAKLAAATAEGKTKAKKENEEELDPSVSPAVVLCRS